MIYDCFLYNGEKDLLDIRRAEMRNVDATLCLFQSFETFTGIKKDHELIHHERNERNERFMTHSLEIGPTVNPANDPWINEKTLRNGILSSGALLGAKPDDIIIISDIDEIPRASAIENWNGDTYAALIMDKFGFWLNCEEQHQGWHRARIMKYSYLNTTTPEEVRNAGFPEQINDAGWHWSWLGGIDEVIRKFKSFSHQENEVQKHAVREELEQKIKTGQSLWGQDFWKIVPINEHFPHYIQNHQFDTLKHLIFHGNT